MFLYVVIFTLSPDSENKITDASIETGNLSNIDEDIEIGHNSQPINEEKDAYTLLREIRSKNLDRVLIGSLNINSVRNKFDALSDLVEGKLEILLISESKLDASFYSANFVIPGFSTPYRRDRNCFGGGILVYIREDIPSKLLATIQIPDNVECLIIEIRLKKIKWILINLYNPSKSQISSQIAFLGKAIDHYSTHYDNILILGDFNTEMSENSMIEFCARYNLKNLVKEPTCYKNLTKPTCISI